MTLPALTIIPAGAGSGKTYRIQEQLAAWVSEGLVAPDKIVAVTFTEVAAAELRDRIRSELVKRGRPEDALKLDHAYISTIHGFGLRILTEFAFEAGVSPNARLLSEDEENILIRLALARTDKADDIIGNLASYGYKYDYNSGKGSEDRFRDTVLQLIGKLRSIGKLEDDPKLVPHALGKIQELYGPTGDATELTKDLRLAIKRLLKQFPGDISNAYEGNKTAVKEFHGDFVKLKKAESDQTLDSDWQLWQNLRSLRKSKRGAATPAGYDDLAEAVMDAANALPMHPGPLNDALKHVESLLGVSKESLSGYAKDKRDKGLVDYTDMLALAYRLLVTNKDVLNVLRNRVDCLVIDEFQDTNPLQFSLLWSLHEAGVPTLVVGDLKQAIMGFQNADPRLLDQLQRKFKDSTKPLESNWRSTPFLMKWINRVGNGLFGEAYIKLEPKAGYSSSMVPLEVIHYPMKANKDVRAKHTVLRIKTLLDDESQKVYDKTINGQRQFRGSDVAIICPTNTRLVEYAGALSALGVRCQIEQGDWFESRVIQIAYHALSYVADPSDKHAALFLAVTELGSHDLKSALSALIDSASLDDPVIACLDKVVENLKDKTVDIAVDEVINVLELYDRVALWPEAAQHRANLLRLQGEAKEFLYSNREALASGGYYGSGIKTFLSWLKAKAEKDDGQPEPRVRDEDAVQLMTWHKSKGKEWPVVAVCSTDCEVEARLPSLDVVYEDFSDLQALLDKAKIEMSPAFVAPETNDAFLEPLQEEAEDGARRLLYVALTRSREKLILEWPGYLEGSDTVTYWSMLKGAARMELKAAAILVDGEDFECSITTATKEPPPEFDIASDDIIFGLPVIGRRAIEQGEFLSTLTTEALTPSSLRDEMPVNQKKTVHIIYGKKIDIELHMDAGQRGILLHRCFEVLDDGNYDIGFIKKATGYDFTDEQHKALSGVVKPFYKWLNDYLYHVGMAREVPILAIDSQGSVVSGFVDLLVETKEGVWIIDHKSDLTDDLAAQFNFYLPQLECYSKAIKLAIPDKPVLGVAINWISHGSVSILRYQ